MRERFLPAFLLQRTQPIDRESDFANNDGMICK
jgi:hypothetical protein